MSGILPVDPVEVPFAELGDACAATTETTCVFRVPGLNPAGGLSGAVPAGWSLIRVDGDVLVLQRHSVKRRARALSFQGRA